MNKLRKLQGSILNIMFLLTWFAAVLLIVGLVGELFNIKVMNGELWAVFGLIIGLLMALVILHVVITLNIISNSLSSYNDSTPSRIDLKQIAIATVAVAVIIIGIQLVVDNQIKKGNLEQLQKEVVEIGNSTTVNKIITQVETDAKMKDLYFTRDVLLLSLKDNSVELLIPKIRDGAKIYNIITPYDYDPKDERKISEALQRIYIPSKDIKPKFDRMLTDRKSFEVITDNETKIFYPVEKNGEIKLIIILSTSNTINYEYLKARTPSSAEMAEPVQGVKNERK